MKFCFEKFYENIEPFSLTYNFNYFAQKKPGIKKSVK